MSQALVVKKSILEKTDFWQKIPHNNEGKILGMIRLNTNELEKFLDVIEKNKEFKERYGPEGIESKSEWQQIISYGLICQNGKFFVYQRGGKDSTDEEKRLQEKISIGVGGHIEPFDSLLIDSLYRELDEELIFKKNGQEINLKDNEGNITKKSFTNLVDIEIIGLIKNELTEIDECHLGLAFKINLIDRDLEIKIKEGENIDGKMMSLIEYQDWIKQGKVIPEFWTDILIKEMGSELLPKKEEKTI